MVGQEITDGPHVSPNLAPMEFYLWGKLKQQMYSKIPITREDMKELIRRACVAIDPNEIRRAVLFVSTRFRKCIYVHHFEHLL